jgi:hypothetical protein
MERAALPSLLVAAGLAVALLAGPAVVAPAAAQDGGLPTISAIRLGQHPGKTRLVIDLSEVAGFAYRFSKGGRVLRIHLPDADWSGNAAPRRGRGLIGSWRVESRPNQLGADLYVDTKAAARVRQAFLLAPDKHGGHRVVLDLVAGAGPQDRLWRTARVAIGQPPRVMADFEPEPPEDAAPAGAGKGSEKVPKVALKAAPGAPKSLLRRPQPQAGAKLKAPPRGGVEMAKRLMDRADKGAAPKAAKAAVPKPPPSPDDGGRAVKKRAPPAAVPAPPGDPKEVPAITLEDIVQRAIRGHPTVRAAHACWVLPIATWMWPGLVFCRRWMPAWPPAAPAPTIPRPGPEPGAATTASTCGAARAA